MEIVYIIYTKVTVHASEARKAARGELLRSGDSHGSETSGEELNSAIAE